MYVVYKLFFKSSDKVYIGKTFNIKKRITDHLYSVNVLKENTHKANWIRKNLKLSELEYEILYETQDEYECYRKELEFIRKFYNSGIEIVNCQRVVEAGGLKGSVRKLSEEDRENRTKLFGKHHILIDKKGNLYETNCLKKWAEERGLQYKNLHSCVKGKSKSSQGYKVFYKEDWENLEEEERCAIIKCFMSYNKHKTREMMEYADSMKKEFWILNKNGYIEHGIGITEYCKKMGYNAGNIINTNRYRTPLYGKILFYSIDDLNNFKDKEYYKFYNVFDEQDSNYIFTQVNKTKKYSRERGALIKSLAGKYHCSERRISDTYNKIYNLKQVENDNKGQ